MFDVLFPEPAPPPARLTGLVIRAAEPGHAAALATIYAEQLALGCATFEDPVPDAAEMGRRLAQVQAAGLPALVAQDGRGVVRGFTWARPWRPHAAYRHTVEDSIHVAAAARRQGVGRLLLGRLIEACAALGCRRMIAVVGDARNRASLALHASLGFAPAGYLTGAGWRPEGPVDVVMLERALAPKAVIGRG